MNSLDTRVRSTASLFIFALSLSVASLLGSTARAADLTPQQKQEMKTLYERATRAYDVGKYNEAIEDYQKAYEIGGDPPMLYNIAQAYRLNDQPNEALRFYRRYLQRAPQARNREDVERKIAELEKAVEDRRKAALAATPPPLPTPPVVTAPPPAPTTPPAPSVVGPPAPTPVTPPANAIPVPGTEIPAAPAPPEGPSTARRVVTWSFIGAGVACGVASLLEGIAAKGKSSDLEKMSAASTPQNPVTYNPDIQTAGKKDQAWAIGLGIGAGALVVTGVVLLVTSGSSQMEAPPQESAPPPAPTAMLAPWLDRGLVGAGAGFRF
jgi:hypothetical protein